MLTLPVVWFFVIEYQWMQSASVGMIVYVVSELLATVFEGVMYSWRGKMGWKSGMAVSLIANTTSARWGWRFNPKIHQK